MTLESRSAVETREAPAAIGPYTQAISHRGLLFVSGQLPLRADGEMIVGSPAEQASQCLENLAAIAKGAGAKLTDALKLTIYTTDLGAFAAINDTYASFFAGTLPPARAVVGVAELPKGADVEIEAVVAIG